MKGATGMNGSKPGRISRLAASVLLAIALVLPGPGSQASDRPIAHVQSLAELAVDPAPWMRMEANSEQRQPVYLGATPREMELGLPPVDRGHPLLPQFLKPLGEDQAKAIRAALVKKKLAPHVGGIEFEAWPVRDDAGRLTWAFVRFRISANPSSPWRWLDADLTTRMKGSTTMKYVIKPLVPDDVYTDRTEFLDYLYHAAREAAHRRTTSTVLLGRRRMGKTEIFKRVINRLFFEQDINDPYTVIPVYYSFKEEKTDRWEFAIGYVENLIRWGAELARKAADYSFYTLWRNSACIASWASDFR
jgi:hypothetical protein